jgi:uncharacterized membrane protein YfcA
MLLIAEIILTIFAWRKGWRWLGLIPLAIPLCIGIVMGIGIGISGGSIDDLPSWTVIFDILAVIALIVMVSVNPKSKEITGASEPPKTL